MIIPNGLQSTAVPNSEFISLTVAARHCVKICVISTNLVCFTQFSRINNKLLEKSMCWPPRNSATKRLVCIFSIDQTNGSDKISKNDSLFPTKWCRLMRTWSVNFNFERTPKICKADLCTKTNKGRRKF